MFVYNISMSEKLDLLNTYTYITIIQLTQKEGRFAIHTLDNPLKLFFAKTTETWNQTLLNILYGHRNTLLYLIYLKCLQTLFTAV